MSGERDRRSLERSYELARAAGDDVTRSYAVRHLAFADGADGDVASAREAGEVAPLAAGACVDEAGVVAAECGAHGAVRWVDRASLLNDGCTLAQRWRTSSSCLTSVRA